MTKPAARIFLSYSRTDIARQFRDRLIAEGLDRPSHDQTHMSAGEWWD